ncbi:MAG: EamA family transporter [Candidatus Wallbacteria bacterium]|nr:EamA family transporter [Candidatus Wallbacteria bacterium]
MSVYGLILACVCLVTVGQLCFRVAARRDEPGNKGILAGPLGHPILWLGVIAFIAHFCVWMLVLNRADLSVAYPLMSLDYVLITVLSSWLLKERVHSRRWIGVAFIVLGVVLIGGS